MMESKAILSESFYKQKGKINVEGGKETAQFWIRVFKLESHISFVQSKLYEKKERKTAATPIIQEFRLNEHLEFIFCLNFTVDPIEATGVIGMVFYCSPEHRQKALELRDNLANQMMESLGEAKRKGQFDEEIETYVSPPLEESDQPPPPKGSR